MGREARVDLVLDCAEPKKLDDFWRAALDPRDYYTDKNVAVLVPNRTGDRTIAGVRGGKASRVSDGESEGNPVSPAPTQRARRESNPQPSDP